MVEVRHPSLDLLLMVAPPHHFIRVVWCSNFAVIAVVMCWFLWCSLFCLIMFVLLNYVCFLSLGVVMLCSVMGAWGIVIFKC